MVQEMVKQAGKQPVQQCHLLKTGVHTYTGHPGNTLYNRLGTAAPDNLSSQAIPHSFPVEWTRSQD